MMFMILSRRPSAVVSSVRAAILQLTFQPSSWERRRTPALRSCFHSFESSRSKQVQLKTKATGRSAVAQEHIADPPLGSIQAGIGPEQEAAIMEDARNRIYVEFHGRQSLLIAHALRSLPDPPPVTLLTPFAPGVETFQATNGKISLLCGNERTEVSGVDVEQIGDYESRRTQGLRGAYLRSITSYSLDEKVRRPIMNLNMTAPTGDLQSGPVGVLKTLSYVNDRITRESTIIFIEKGLGALETSVQTYWKDPGRRPNYVFGCSTNVVYVGAGLDNKGQDMDQIMKQRFKAKRQRSQRPVRPMIESPAGENHGGLHLGIKPTTSETSESYSHLIRCLTSAPRLHVQRKPFEEVFFHKLLWVAVESALNPLGVLLEEPLSACFEKIQNNRSVSELALGFIRESRAVFLARFPGRLKMFDDTLENVIETSRLSTNITPMHRAILLGLPSNVGSLNGYMVALGRSLGINTPNHEAFVELVHTKSAELLAQAAHADEIRRMVEEDLEERRKKKKSSRKKSSRNDSRSGVYEQGEEPTIRLDRLEIKRMKKEQRIKDGLGKQQSEVDYSKPAIKSMGSKSVN